MVTKIIQNYLRILPFPVPQQACNKLSLQITWSLSSPNNLQFTIELITKSLALGGSCCCCCCCCCCCDCWVVLPKIKKIESFKYTNFIL